MNTSIFTVAGPVMIGPSSSHTAGAAKLGRVANQIVDSKFERVDFYLHGSFEKTGKGHGTDKALLAGVMGIYEDDERIQKAFHIAQEKGLEYRFKNIMMKNVHENSVMMKFYRQGNLVANIEGSSIGGGEIVITKIDGYDVQIRGNMTTIFIRQNDKVGVISHIASKLAEHNVNVATMNVSRSCKDEDAICILEVDGNIKMEVAKEIESYKDIKFIKVIKHL